MKENAYGIKMLEDITGVKISKYDLESKCIKTDYKEMQMLYQDKILCQNLIEKAQEYSVLQLYEEGTKILYASFKYENTFFFIGPVSTEIVTFQQRHDFLKSHKLNIENEIGIPVLRFQKFYKICLLYFNFVTGEEIISMDLQNINLKKYDSVERDTSIIEQELEYDKHIAHHTFETEQKIVDAIKNCDRERTFLLMEKVIPLMGKMSAKNLNQLKNGIISFIVVITRVCISSGVQPSKAYAYSDEYLQVLDKTNSEAEIFPLLYKIIDKFIGLIEAREKQRTINHVEKCKIYIDTNYRKKLSLQEIASEVGLNPSYLSHLFSKTEGMSIKEYIYKVRTERAMNLLRFSNSSIMEIGEYVGFESQSYFGKIFKRYTGMTPQMCRDRYQVIEVNYEQEFK